MKYTLLMLATLLSQQAFAHVTPGTYNGFDQEGKNCSMIAGETFFDGKPHPLNERIKITVGEREFLVGHPAVLDFTRSSVGFNHDVFQGVKSTDTGAVAIEIEMMHTTQFEGPVMFTLVENDWKNGKKTKLRCDGIELKK